MISLACRELRRVRDDLERERQRMGRDRIELIRAVDSVDIALECMHDYLTAEERPSAEAA